MTNPRLDRTGRSARNARPAGYAATDAPAPAGYAATDAPAGCIVPPSGAVAVFTKTAFDEPTYSGSGPAMDKLKLQAASEEEEVGRCLSYLRGVHPYVFGSCLASTRVQYVNSYGQLADHGLADDSYGQQTVRALTSMVPSVGSGHQNLDTPALRDVRDRYIASLAKWSRDYAGRDAFRRQILNEAILTLCRMCRSYGEYTAAGDVWSPSGSLTEGVPAPTYQPGMWQFRSNILVLGADPTIDAAAFPTRLTSTVQEIMGGQGNNVMSQTRIVKGAQQNISVPRIQGAASNIPGAGLVPNRDVPGWWVQIDGQFNASAVWTLDNLNRAIARALSSVTRFVGFKDAEYTPRIPADGAQLHAQFREGNACSGGFTPTRVFARACTRVVAVNVPSSQATPPAPPTTAPPAPPTPQGANNAAPQGWAGTNPTCSVRVKSQFWLRPTRTFERQGPNFPANTAITVHGDTGMRQGSLGLYAISVGTQYGYAALSARDLEGCNVVEPPGSGGGSGGSSIVRRTTPTLSPPPGGTTLAMLGNPSSDNTLLYGGAAALALVVIGGIVWKRKEIKSALSGGSHSSHGYHGR